MDDEGEGFDSSKCAHNFTRDGGFGLFAIREMSSQIGGSFEIESAPGNGNLCGARRCRSADGRDPMTLRLLLADDHPIFRAGVRSLLDAQPDMEVIAEVEDGAGAVEAARKHKPDVVVIDVSMPGMNGLEATRRITAEAPGIKVLCLSMHTDSRFVKAAFRSGARGYLLKECALEDLVVAIHTVAAGQIYVSPGLADTVLEGYGAEGSESSALDLLTPREREVLQLLAEGHPAVGHRVATEGEREDGRHPPRAPDAEARHAQPGRPHEVRDPRRRDAPRGVIAAGPR